DSQEVSLFSRTGATVTSEQVQAVHDEFYDVVRLPAVAWKTIADLGLNLSATELIDRLDTDHQTSFIVVSLKMPTPKLAQEAVTIHTENAVTTFRDIRSRSAEVALEFLNAEVDEQAQTLAAAEQALQEFQLENEVSDLNREIIAYQDLRRSLQSDRDYTLVEAKRNERLAEEFQTQADASFAKAENLLASIAISATVTPAEAGEDADAQAPPTPTPDPVMVAAIENLQAQAQAQRRSAAEYSAAASGYRSAAAEYDRILNERQQQHIYLLGLQQQYDELVEAVSRADGSYAFLLDKANEAQLKLNQGKSVGYLQVAEPARLPSSEAPKRTAQLLVVGILVSLLVALVLAFLLEVLERVVGQAKNSSD
ncbi:MAG TPA: hypothetical protein G4N94_10990, partial [Caldilineae bacterium]|nr:hypothetical protein [Caldilineae bacterium]